MAKAEKRFRGVVQWFNDSKAFGFIKPDNGGADLFVHHSSIISEGYRSVLEGERVEYAIANGFQNKTKAIDVTVIVTGLKGAALHSKKENYGAVSGRGRRGVDRRNGGTGGRYQCGDLGHLARDCYGSSNAGGGACFNCGGLGRLARDYMPGNSGSGGGCCFRCGVYGHMARDCSNGVRGGNNGGGCFRCGKFGHFASDCSKEGVSYGGSRGNAGKRGCFNGGKPGHFARECVEASG